MIVFARTRRLNKASEAPHHRVRRRFAEAPDRGDLERRRAEAPEVTQHEAPDAGEACYESESSHGRCQS